MATVLGLSFLSFSCAAAAVVTTAVAAATAAEIPVVAAAADGLSHKKVPVKLYAPRGIFV